MEKTVQDKETKERNLYSDLQRRMLGKDVKQRMENKMQDSKRTRYLGTYVYHEGRWYLLQEDVEEILNSEISKAREEGYEEGMRAVLYPKLKRDKNGTIKREGWVDTSKLKEKK